MIAGCGGRESEFSEALGYGFELEKGWEDDMDVWLGTLRLVYIRHRCSGKDYDGYVLGDGRVSIVRKESRVWVAEGIIGGAGIVGWE